MPKILCCLRHLSESSNTHLASLEISYGLANNCNKASPMHLFKKCSPFKSGHLKTWDFVANKHIYLLPLILQFLDAPTHWHNSLWFCISFLRGASGIDSNLIFIVWLLIYTHISLCLDINQFISPINAKCILFLGWNSEYFELIWWLASEFYRTICVFFRSEL